MNKTPPSLGRVLVIAAFSVSCFGLLLFLWVSFGGNVPLQPKGYRVQVSFADAAQLADRADVKVAGIPVGKVVGKKHDPHGNRTLATLELEPQYAPLHTDARAILRQKTLLGETYVQLTLGTKGSRTIPEGGRLANAQVQPAVTFDQLLEVFDPSTRRAFRAWMRSSAQAGDGRAEDLNAALGNLPQFAEGARDVLGVLSDREDALRSLVRGTRNTFNDLSANQAALQSAITSSEQTFATLSQHHEALAQSIEAFPAFLRESRTTLNRLASFSDETTPLVRDLQPVLRDARPTVRSLRELSPDLRSLFTNLRPLIDASAKGLPALGSVLRGLAPTLAETGPFLQQLNPILQFLELEQSTVADFLSIPPSALGLKLPAPPGSGTTGHALPQVIVAGTQTPPAATRTPDNRGDAYFPPGSLASPSIKDPSHFTLPSFDCNNVGGPKPPGSTPGCLVAGDVTFQGRTTHFPQVQPNAPGGVDPQPRK